MAIKRQKNKIVIDDLNTIGKVKLTMVMSLLPHGKKFKDVKTFTIEVKHPIKLEVLMVDGRQSSPDI